MEAAFNANMPFKWNATRIQVLPNQRAGPGGPGSGAPPSQQGLTASTTLNSQIFTNAGPPPQGGLGLLPKPLNVPPPAHPGPQHHQARGGGGGGGSNDFTGPRDPFGNPRGSSSGRPNSSPARSLTGGGGGSQGSAAGGGGKSSDKSAADRGASRRGGAPRGEERRVERSRELSRDKERSRVSPPPARKRSRSPVRTRSRSPRTRTPSRSRSPRSPPRRRARTAPRYNVSVPKMSLHFPESNVFDLKHRYSHM